MFIWTHPNIFPWASLAVMGLPIIVPPQHQPPPQPPLTPSMFVHPLTTRATSSSKLGELVGPYLLPFLGLAGLIMTWPHGRRTSPSAMWPAAAPDDDGRPLTLMLLDLPWYPIEMRGQFWLQCIIPAAEHQCQSLWHAPSTSRIWCNPQWCTALGARRITWDGGWHCVGGVCLQSIICLD